MISMTPTSLTGKDLEKLVLQQNERYEADRLATVGRYGVQAVHMGDDKVQVLQSLPDFEGVFHGGRQLIFDCKACSQASFAWAKYRTETKGARSRQLKHMRRRSRFGAVCFFLMHWNERQLKSKTINAQTWLLPVEDTDSYWDDVDGGVVRTLTLEDCQDRGIQVNWVIPQRCRKPLPDYLAAIEIYTDVART